MSLLCVTILYVLLRKVMVMGRGLLSYRTSLLVKTKVLAAKSQTLGWFGQN